jgi:putative ABC transport system permease protein
VKTLRLALRLVARDFRAGELRVLLVAIVLAVASVGTVAFFADRVKQGLVLQSNKLLGADLMVSGDRPLPGAYDDEAKRLGLATSPAIRFNSMVELAHAPDANAVLTDVKAITSPYPLRGAITLVTVPKTTREASGIPRPGEAWVDTRLADRIGAHVGSEVSVGDATLVVSAIVAQEPEIAGLTFAPGPKLLVNLQDVPATNLLTPGNRATYRLLVAERAPGELERFRAYVTKNLAAGQRMETVRDLRPEVRQTLERAERFLGLAALVAVLLAAAAVALAASRYLRRHVDTAAMLRCFGAPGTRTLALFVVQFAVLGVAACAIGLAFAFLAQEALAALMSGAVVASLPPPGVYPAVVAIATGLLLLFGFALPPLVALAGVTPLRVLRRDLPLPRRNGVLAYAAGIGTIALLVGWQAREAQAALVMLGGVGGILVASGFIAWLLLAALKRLPVRGLSWRFGLANLRRRPFASSLQIGALALGLTALLLLTLVRGDLLANWRASLPPDAPNQFLVNVLPDQVADARTWIDSQLHVDAQFKPMVRGRLVEVNGASLDTSGYDEPRARRLAEREWNLSWTDRLPDGNRVVEGRFWTHDARGADAGISLEEGIAQTLRVRVGDRLTFDAGGMRVSAPVTSLRKVDWDSFRVNFFALFAPAALDALPATYIAAFRAPEGDTSWLSTLVKRYPNVLAIDVAEILAQIDGILDRVAHAVQFVFLFTLAAGLVLLQAAIASTQDERRFDAAILRTLGASSRQLSAAQAAEFALLGAVAGLLGAAGATAIGAALADRVFNIPFAGNPYVWLYGIVGGALAVLIAGILGTRQTLREPPLRVLRQLG